MALSRLSVGVADLASARILAEKLAETVEPRAAAVSLFADRVTGGWQVEAYFEVPPDQSAIAAAIGPLFMSGQQATVEPVPDENWVAISQAALPPVVAGRFIVHGSHDRRRVGLRLNGIEIDAGEAFGTAHHATTEGCLLALDIATRRRRFHRVLDLGCGSGVLAIAAARSLPRAQVLASDIDPVAVAVACANVGANRARARICPVAAASLSHPALRAAGRFDLVVANILAGPLLALAPQMRRAIRPRGLAILSGILAGETREVAAVYETAGFRLHSKRILSGWATLVLERGARR